MKLIKNVKDSWKFSSVWVAAIVAAVTWAEQTVASFTWLPDKWVAYAMVALIVVRLINFTPDAGE